MEAKNTAAQKIIGDYATKAAFMGIGVGAVSWIPGAAIPAIFANLAIQRTAVYQPMARDLADLYHKNADAYTDSLGERGAAQLSGAEFAAEFALEFLMDQAQEIALDAGLGALASFIPGIGFAAGVALDYAISQMLTWRVGTMTSLYFQNTGEWIGDRKQTLNIAKGLTGGLTSSWKTSKEESSKSVRVELNTLITKVPELRNASVQHIIPVLKGFADKLPRTMVRDSLIAMGLSAVLVDLAMSSYYA